METPAAAARKSKKAELSIRHAEDDCGLSRRAQAADSGMRSQNSGHAVKVDVRFAPA